MTRPVVAWLAVNGADPLGQAVGVVALVASGLASRRRHSISWLVVHPAARRQGIGRLLVEQTCRHAWEGAADRVWVECRSDWSAALAFWQTLGFSPYLSEPS